MSCIQELSFPRSTPPSGSSPRLAQWVAATGLGLLLLAPVASAQANGPISPVPRYNNGVDSFFYIDLANGGSYLVEDLDSPPTDLRQLKQNIFSEIGRPTTQVASPGEVLTAPIVAGGDLRAILFVEASTGFVAFFDGPGRGGNLGTISTAIGRPFESIASTDGNYALLPYRDDSGRTVGAYLYHAIDGRAVYLDGLRKLEPDGTATPLDGWPQMSHQVATATLQSSREETVGYLLIDSGDGTIHQVRPAGGPTRVQPQTTSLALFDALSAEAKHPTPQRIVAIGLQGSNDATRSVLFVDVATGEMAALRGIDSGQNTLGKLPRNVYEVLGTAVSETPRWFSLVPADEDGETQGVYLIDSLTRSILRIDRPDNPGATTIQRIGNIAG